MRRTVLGSTLGQAHERASADDEGVVFDHQKVTDSPAAASVEGSAPWVSGAEGHNSWWSST